MGMGWFAENDNHDYIAEDFIQLSNWELRPFKEAASSLYDLMIRAAREVSLKGLWHELGIPSKAIDLMKYSLQNEMGTHLISRFDFAGGLDGMPLKMLELNADTCSLMAETHFIMEQQKEEYKRQLPTGQPFNNLLEGLTNHFKNILQKHPDKAPTLLLSTLGFDEDWLNTAVVTLAARRAGFQQVQEMLMEKIIFSPDEGFFIQTGKEEYQQFDFWFKFVPWEMIVFEEPELFEILDNIIRNKKGVVVNPAYSMMLQSKALMKVMHDLEPSNPFLLKTKLSSAEFYDNRFVQKPKFGRMGENISYFNGSDTPVQETGGDYGNYDPVYQELASFNLDEDMDRYQASIFWTDQPSALCFRRCEGNILNDEDAEYMGHIVTP